MSISIEILPVTDRYLQPLQPTNGMISLSVRFRTAGLQTPFAVKKYLGMRSQSSIVLETLLWSFVTNCVNNSSWTLFLGLSGGFFILSSLILNLEVSNTSGTTVFAMKTLYINISGQTIKTRLLGFFLFLSIVCFFS
ncbi:MAG: hypothetical protein H0V39_00130 [Nitrosomonas sp.]|nr:hypothetical protein [Nitrosomonas sp.]